MGGHYLLVFIICALSNYFTIYKFTIYLIHQHRRAYVVIVSQPHNHSNTTNPSMLTVKDYKKKANRYLCNAHCFNAGHACRCKPHGKAIKFFTTRKKYLQHMKEAHDLVFFSREYELTMWGERRGTYSIPYLSAKAVARGRKLCNEDPAAKFDEKNNNWIPEPW